MPLKINIYDNVVIFQAPCRYFTYEFLACIVIINGYFDSSHFINSLRARCPRPIKFGKKSLWRWGHQIFWLKWPCNTVRVVIELTHKLSYYASKIINWIAWWWQHQKFSECVRDTLFLAYVLRYKAPITIFLLRDEIRNWKFTLFFLWYFPRVYLTRLTIFFLVGTCR